MIDRVLAYLDRHFKLVNNVVVSNNGTQYLWSKFRSEIIMVFGLTRAEITLCILLWLNTKDTIITTKKAVTLFRGLNRLEDLEKGLEGSGFKLVDGMKN